MKVTQGSQAPIRLLVAVAGALAATAGGQNLTSTPILTLHPAVEISMPTEPGKVYQMQVSSDLQSWQNHGAPVFGTGRPLLQPMSGAADRFFRLNVLSTPLMGDAPWSIEGTTLQLNEGTRTVRYDFQANGIGHSLTGITRIPFTWTWLRDGLSCGRAELTFPEHVKDVIQLKYAAPKIGQFSRKSYLGTRLDNTDAGTFGPALGTASPLVPASIVGRSFALSEQPGGNALSVVSPNAGTRLMDGTHTSFSGNWLVTGHGTARLTANFSATHGEDYRFTFTSALTGRYTRQTFTEGVFRDEDLGNFCLTTAP